MTKEEENIVAMIKDSIVYLQRSLDVPNEERVRCLQYAKECLEGAEILLDSPYSEILRKRKALKLEVVKCPWCNDNPNDRHRGLCACNTYCGST